MDNGKISVIIPIYNSEKYLKRCLDSVINQTYKNLEIICVNDGSKDNSLQILQEYAQKDNRIIIIDKENAGVSAARNDGIRKATGEYIGFVDSDDWIELDMYEKMYKALKKYNTDIVRISYYKNDTFENTVPIYNLPEYVNKKLSRGNYDYDNELVSSIVKENIPSFLCLLLVKRNVVKKTNLLDESIVFGEDIIFFLELLDNSNSIYFLDSCLYHYFCCLTSCTNSSNYLLRNIYNMILLNEIEKKVLNQSRFNIKNYDKVIDTKISEKIASNFYMLYKTHFLNNKELKKELNDFVSDDKAHAIFLNALVHSYPIHIGIPIFLIKKRKINILLLFYRIRYIISILKI